MRQREKAGIRRAKLIKSIQGEKKRSNALIKKQMILLWATNPRSIPNHWGNANKREFISFWCQWFPKNKVIARWNKCLKA
jgi:hypothetical protein